MTEKAFGCEFAAINPIIFGPEKHEPFLKTCVSKVPSDVEYSPVPSPSIYGLP
jgi:hypothetical protein